MLPRNGVLGYNLYKLYVRKLRVPLRTAWEQYYIQRLCSQITKKLYETLVGSFKRYTGEK